MVENYRKDSTNILKMHVRQLTIQSFDQPQKDKRRPVQAVTVTEHPQDERAQLLDLAEHPNIYQAVRAAHNAVLVKLLELQRKEEEKRTEEEAHKKLDIHCTARLQATIKKLLENSSSLTNDTVNLRGYVGEHGVSLFYKVSELFEMTQILTEPDKEKPYSLRNENNESIKRRLEEFMGLRVDDANILSLKSLLARMLLVIDEKRFLERHIIPAFIKKGEGSNFFVRLLSSIEKEELKNLLTSLSTVDYQVFNAGCPDTVDSHEKAKEGQKTREGNLRNVAKSLLEIAFATDENLVFESMLEGTKYIDKNGYTIGADRQSEIIFLMFENYPKERKISFKFISELYKRAKTEFYGDKIAEFIISDDSFTASEVSGLFRSIAEDSQLRFSEHISTVSDGMNSVLDSDKIPYMKYAHFVLREFGKLVKVNDYLRCRRVHAIEQFAKLEGQYQEGFDVLSASLYSDDPLVVNKTCEVILNPKYVTRGVSDLANIICEQIENGETCLPLACIIRMIGYEKHPGYVSAFKEVLSRDLNPVKLKERISEIDSLVLFDVNEEEQRATVNLDGLKFSALMQRILKPFILWMANGAGLDGDEKENLMKNASTMFEYALELDKKESEESTETTTRQNPTLRDSINNIFSAPEGWERECRRKENEAINRKGYYDENDKQKEALEAKKNLELHQIIIKKLLELVGIVDQKKEPDDLANLKFV